MKPEGSLLHSQEPATSPYPQSYQSSPCLPIPHLEDTVYISIYAYVFQVASFSHISTPNPVCISPLPMHATWHTNLIFLIWSP